MAFTRMVVKLDRGQNWGELHGGLLCLPMGALTWNTGEHDVKTRDFDDIFREEMTKVGFKVAGDPDNLFERGDSSGEYAVAGSITDINENVCYPWAGMRNYRKAKGRASVVIEWQVYSRLRREVVFKVKTTGDYHTDRTIEGGTNPILLNAFADNVKQLTANETFRKIFVGAATVAASPASQTPIALPGAVFAGKRAISDVVGSVVVVFAGAGTGSGALVSRDGYVVTNQHVVGAEKYVKVRWSDGFDSLGEVIRSDKARDVALIKTDPHGRQPLAFRTGPVQTGDTVYAVGAPFGPQFQNTVTKGIVSASNRILNGFAFIQSDVMVNHGNSGGPLVNEDGAIVGLTDLGIQPENEPAGLNMFIPAQDVLDFLGLKPAS